MSGGVHLFDAAKGELQTGVNLIEASAGTGKTYTIAMLVLRLVAETSLTIDELLLVTFTRAATEELAQRVRQRLAEARDMLTGRETSDDPTLHQWIGGLKNGDEALARIREALLDIDRAPVFTIHGFCQRMLQELALESDQVFDAELQPDTDEVTQEIVRDFWRQRFYDLPAHVCGALLFHYQTPVSLYQSVSPLTGHFSRVEPVTGSFVSARQSFEESYINLAAWWQLHGNDLSTQLSVLGESGKLKKLFAEDHGQWCESITGYLSSQKSILPDNIDRLTREGFRKCINGSRVRGAKQDELLDKLNLPEDLSERFLANLQEMILQLRCELVRYLLSEKQQRMRQKSLMSYDDLIVRLHQALQEPSGRLVALIRERFKAALIDEFQDTDMLQWQIFGTVFGAGSHYLYLIGDPKQAIYKFRGADIHTYFLARTTAETIYTLTHNYRSHPALVEEVNALFKRHKKPFLYDPSRLPFMAVTPARKGDEEQCVMEGRPGSKIVYCQLPEMEDSSSGVWTSGKAAEMACGFATREIVRLLDSPAELVERHSRRTLQPGDIAILVRKHSQAEMLKDALTAAGVPAVLFSRMSVFLTRECEELLHLLEALAEPGNSEGVRKAMTITWFGLSGDDLYRIWHDESLLDRYLSHFQIYGEMWSTKGVLVMMNNLLAGERVFTILAEGDRAERKIANIHHLLELLQQAETEMLYGPLQLLQWLKRNMEKGAEEDELRLESDEDAVRLVTMHGAKGLEYKVVFCPFLWYRQSWLDREELRVLCHEDGELVLDLGSNEFERRRIMAMEDDMAEELRLTYVALTRAKLRCYVLWCDCRSSGRVSVDSFSSGLGYLLFPEGRISHKEQRARLLEQITEHQSEYVSVAMVSRDKPIHLESKAAPVTLDCKKRSRGTIAADYQMTSYSALAGGIESINVPHGDISEISGTDLPVSYADLPSGANFGNAVHDIFEAVPFSLLARPSGQRQVIEEKCERFGLDLDITLLEEMVATVVAAPLGSIDAAGGEPFSLADVNDSRCVKEMAFYFHLRDGEGGAVNTILQDDPTVRPIAETILRGYLTGFVDLVFQHGDAFYIADYKTNNLGPNAAHYQPDSLVEAMAEHNYGLQLWLYSLVLHRYLKNFLSGYEYDRHFGGVFYLFLRGMERFPDGIYYRKPEQNLLDRLDRCLGGA